MTKRTKVIKEWLCKKCLHPFEVHTRLEGLYSKRDFFNNMRAADSNEPCCYDCSPHDIWHGFVPIDNLSLIEHLAKQRKLI